jgi:hypothetical protein
VDTTGVYVVGDANIYVDQDALIKQLDLSTGSVLWSRQFGSANSDGATAAAVDGSDVYVVGGTSGALPGQTSFGDVDAFIRHYDTAGNELWTAQFGTSGTDIAYGVNVSASGINVVGELFNSGYDAFLRRFSTAGAQLADLRFTSNSGDDVAVGVATTSRSVFLAGWTTGRFAGQQAFGGMDAFVGSLGRFPP